MSRYTFDPESGLVLPGWAKRRDGKRLSALGPRVCSLNAAGAASFFAAGPLLLDALGLATSGAYSLRRLRANYSGPCVHVRKTGDATGIDVGFVGNDLDTSAITTYAAGGAATASAWPDQGAGTTLGPYDTVNQTVDPAITNGSGVLISVGTAGRSGIKFNGSTQFFKHASAPISQPLTRLLVLRFDSIASGQDIYSNAVDNAIYFQSSGRLDMFANTTQAVKTGISAADFACVIFSFNGASSGASYNGVESTLAGSPGTTGMGIRVLGAAYNGTAASAPAAITVVEDIVFIAATSVAQRAVIYNIVKPYWGTP